MVLNVVFDVLVVAKAAILVTQTQHRAAAMVQGVAA